MKGVIVCDFLLIVYPPPRKIQLTKHKGSAALACVIVFALVSSMLGLSTAKVTQTAMNGTSSNQTSAEAAQIAQNDAELLRSVSYQDVAPSSRKAVEGTPFQHEMTVSSESDFNSSVKQKTVTIKVFKGAETNPRSELRLTRYSSEQTASGVPIGTIIVWASAKNPTDGTWLDCNGQSCAGYAELVSILGKSTVPDYRNRFLEGSTTPGTVLEAGLPDISGTFGNHGHDQDGDNGRGGKRTSGAFKIIQSWCRPSAGRDSNGGNTVLFQASLSNSIYGRSSTVQPPAVTVRYLIKAA